MYPGKLVYVVQDCIWQVLLKFVAANNEKLFYKFQWSFLG
jgi:hypothetical protein